MMRLETRNPQATLSIRQTILVSELPQVLGAGYAAIEKRLSDLGEAPTGPPFVAYYNMDMQNLDIELGFPVAKPLAGEGSVQPGEIPGGEMAICDYTGPYSELSAVYQELMTWIETQALKPTGISYEFYLNDPTITPPEALRTLIGFPLQSNL